MLSTMAEQKKFFSRRKIHAANNARDLHHKIGRPIEAEFQSILLKQKITRNCPITPSEDAKRALVIHGPDIAVLKCKTTRSLNSGATGTTFKAVPIPPPVLEHHQNITLCVDFFFGQGILFYHTISRARYWFSHRPSGGRSQQVSSPPQDPGAANRSYMLQGSLSS